MINFVFINPFPNEHTLRDQCRVDSNINKHFLSVNSLLKLNCYVPLSYLQGLCLEKTFDSKQVFS